MFTVTIVATVVVNYALALLCDDCYVEGNSVQFPDHLFISSTLREPPTHYIGMAGFCTAAILGITAGTSRFYQVQSLTERIELQSIRDQIQLKNRASVIRLWIFGVSLIVLSICIRKHQPFPLNLVHSFSSFLMMMAFLEFVLLQLDGVERTLMTNLPHTYPDTAPLLYTDTM